MKTIVMISKVASTSTARIATIVPATNSPRLFESDASIGSRGPVVGVLPRSLISAGSVASTVGKAGDCSPLPVTIAMLLGVGVGSFVGCGACVVVVNRETVVIANIEGKVLLGVIETVLMLLVGLGSEVRMLFVERDEGQG